MELPSVAAGLGTLQIASVEEQRLGEILLYTQAFIRLGQANDCHAAPT